MNNEMPPIDLSEFDDKDDDKPKPVFIQPDDVEIKTTTVEEGK